MMMETQDLLHKDMRMNIEMASITAIILPVLSSFIKVVL